MKIFRIVGLTLRAHPYRWSVGALVVATSFWAATIVDWVISGQANLILLRWSCGAVLLTLPFAVTTHVRRRWAREAEAEAIAAQLDADELAAHNRGFESLRAAAEAPTMLIPTQQPHVYRSERSSPYGELAYQLRCEITESTGDVLRPS